MNGAPHEFSVALFLDFVNDALRTIVDPGAVAVVGEVAEFKVTQGKWVWFKLKDEQGEAVMDCFWTTFGMNVQIEDGMRLRVFGYPKINHRFGKFSFTIQKAEPVGEGALKRSYELLKKKLAAEGLFAPERKRVLPEIPQTIGLITSPDAAAYTDFLRILGNRWGGLTIKFFPVAVQGEKAVPEILRAFEYFNGLPPEERPEVLVLTRGGGSMEDLHAFNAEEVARAIYGSVVPVIVGVGHERDESLADFVADVRASTPSNAAERLVPDRISMLRRVESMMAGMEHQLQESLYAYKERLTDHAGQMERFFTKLSHNVDRAVQKLQFFPRRLEQMQKTVALQASMLRQADPARLLQRGWSIVRNQKGAVVKEERMVDNGEVLEVRLWHGTLTAVAQKSAQKQSKLL